jgi:CRISPR/Cas system-associated endonuclease Cas3-HD
MPFQMILINPNYSQELTIHNRTLVGLVINQNNKIVDQSFMKREALPEWFEKKRAVYSAISHKFLIAAMSISGEVIDNQDYNLPSGLGSQSPVKH